MHTTGLFFDALRKSFALAAVFHPIHVDFSEVC